MSHADNTDLTKLFNKRIPVPQIPPNLSWTPPDEIKNVKFYNHKLNNNPLVDKIDELLKAELKD